MHDRFFSPSILALFTVSLAIGQDEFPLVSTTNDTWVGQYVRVIAKAHTGVTGLVHRTGCGWVSIVTARGEIKKRAADLIVIPGERAKLSDSILRDFLAKALAGEELPPFKEPGSGSGRGKGKEAPRHDQVGRGSRGAKGRGVMWAGPALKESA